MRNTETMRGVLVGLGGRGRHWMWVCQESPEVEMVGFVEPVPDRRENAVKDFGLAGDQLFSSLDEALQMVEADFVIDVTPPVAREAIARMALDQGLHVLAEKAMGADWPMARRIAARAAADDRCYMVAQNYRFRGLARTTRRLLEEGFLGDLGAVVVGFYYPWGRGAHYVKIPHALLLEMAVHHFDTLRYVLGRDPVRVWARTWNASWGWHQGNVAHAALFEFEGGLMATHHALGCSVGRRSPWDGEWRLEGARGSLVWGENELRYTRSFPREEERDETLLQDVLPASDTSAVLAEFLAAIRQRREPECSPRDNLKTLAMVFGAMRSAEQGREVAMNELFAEDE